MSDESSVKQYIYTIEELLQYAESPLITIPEFKFEPKIENIGAYAPRSLTPSFSPSSTRRTQRGTGTYTRRQERRHNGSNDTKHYGHRDDDNEIIEDWLAPTDEAGSNGLVSHRETVAAFEQWKAMQKPRKFNNAEETETASTTETPVSASSSTKANNSGPLKQPSHLELWETPLSLPATGQTSSRFSTFFKPQDPISEPKGAAETVNSTIPVNNAAPTSTEGLNKPPGLNKPASHASVPSSNRMPTMPPGIPINLGMRGGDHSDDKPSVQQQQYPMYYPMMPNMPGMPNMPPGMPGMPNMPNMPGMPGMMPNMPPYVQNPNNAQQDPRAAQSQFPYQSYQQHPQYPPFQYPPGLNINAPPNADTAFFEGLLENKKEAK